MNALKKLIPGFGFVLLAFAAGHASAQQPGYGPALNLETAKKIAAASVAEAKRNKWNVAISIVDTHGFPVYFELLDDTQSASGHIAVEKSRTAAMFRRPSKVFEDGVAGGRVAIIGLPGATPIEGGLPVIVGGRVVGAIGVSGVSSAQDAQVAQAGLAALTAQK